METEKQEFQPNEQRNAPAEALADLPVGSTQTEEVKGGGIKEEAAKLTCANNLKQISL